METHASKAAHPNAGGGGADKPTDLGVEQLLSDLYRRAKGRLKRSLQQTLTREATEMRIQYLAKVARVRTIWQVDASVDIADFYFPTSIEFGDRARRVETLSALQLKQLVVVEGIAGQGKSMFMRHLCKDCIERGSHIPIFIQLHRIRGSVRLTDLARDTLKTVLSCDDPVLIAHLIRRHLLVFILDGFDEIAGTLRLNAIQEIESFSAQHPDVPIVISSRPSSDVQQLPVVDIVRIKPLGEQDRSNLIRHLVPDEKTRTALMIALNGKRAVTDILVTPLLVTLLIITYKAQQEIPENLSDFYRVLFMTLLKRHDKTKPGYIRERRTQLGDRAFERIFENLCFLSLNDYKLSMPEWELRALVDKAVDSENIREIDAHDYIDDLVRITCLIIFEGEKYYYIHKSVPEYFAAQHVADQSNVELKELFYQQLRESPIPENWYQTLFFLGEIDEYLYVERLLVPYLCRTFYCDMPNIPPEPPPLTQRQILVLVGERAGLHIRHVGEERYVVKLTLETKNWFTNTQLHRALEATLQLYVNSLSYLMLGPLLRAAKQRSEMHYAFDEGSCWVGFVSYFNHSAPIRDVYRAILARRGAIQRHDEKTRPLFRLNLSGIRS